MRRLPPARPVTILGLGRIVASHRRPDMISDYFDGSTIIDDKNKERQAHLRVEDAWPTKDCYFL